MEIDAEPSRPGRRRRGRRRPVGGHRPLRRADAGLRRRARRSRTAPRSSIERTAPRSTSTRCWPINDVRHRDRRLQEDHAGDRSGSSTAARRRCKGNGALINQSDPRPAARRSAAFRPARELRGDDRVPRRAVGDDRGERADGADVRPTRSPTRADLLADERRQLPPRRSARCDGRSPSWRSSRSTTGSRSSKRSTSRPRLMKTILRSSGASTEILRVMPLALQNLNALGQRPDPRTFDPRGSRPARRGDPASVCDAAAGPVRSAQLIGTDSRWGATDEQAVTSRGTPSAAAAAAGCCWRRGARPTLRDLPLPGTGVSGDTIEIEARVRRGAQPRRWRHGQGQRRRQRQGQDDHDRGLTRRRRRWTSEDRRRAARGRHRPAALHDAAGRALRRHHQPRRRAGARGRRHPRPRRDRDRADGRGRAGAGVAAHQRRRAGAARRRSPRSSTPRSVAARTTVRTLLEQAETFLTQANATTSTSTPSSPALNSSVSRTLRTPGSASSTGRCGRSVRRRRCCARTPRPDGAARRDRATSRRPRTTTVRQTRDQLFDDHPPGRAGARRVRVATRAVTATSLQATWSPPVTCVDNIVPGDYVSPACSASTTWTGLRVLDQLARPARAVIDQPEARHDLRRGSADATPRLVMPKTAHGGPGCSTR